MRALLISVLLLCSAVPHRQPLVLHLAGDSTMAPKLDEKRPETGWGEALQQFFDEAKVRVENHAANGRSTRTFIAERRWQTLLDRLRPGDWIFIQFGHNDGSIDKEDRYASPAEYRANLERMVADVRERGATPVLLTPVVRRRFDASGEFYDSHGEYPDLVRAVAAEKGTALLDLHAASARLLREHGAEASKALFLHLAAGESVNYPDGLRDDTHFSPRGAAQIARLAVNAIREAELDLARHLVATVGAGQ